MKSLALLGAGLAGLLSGAAFVAMTTPRAAPPQHFTVPVGVEAVPPLQDPRFADWVATQAPSQLVEDAGIDLFRFRHDKQRRAIVVAGPLTAAADPAAMPEASSRPIVLASAPSLPAVRLPAPMPPVFSVPPQAMASPR